ncbi:MAG: hypothetical protein ABEH65_10365 [Halobacteriales archaeon]
MSRDWGLVRDLRRAGRRRDLLILSLPTLVLLGIYQASDLVKQSLTLSHAMPSIIPAFTTHYVHYTQHHLTANLLVYLLLAPVVYAFTVMAGRRQFFFVAFWTYVLVFPIVLSASSVVVFREGQLFGFSGVALTFAGFLPVAMTRYLGCRYSGPIDLDTAPSLFFLGTSIVAFLTVPNGRLRLSLVIASGIIGILYLWYPVRRLHQSRRGSFLEDTDRIGMIELVVFSIIAYYVILVVAFRTSMVGETSIVNLYLHFLGFSIGFLASYLTFRIDRKFES